MYRMATPKVEFVAVLVNGGFGNNDPKTVKPEESFITGYKRCVFNDGSTCENQICTFQG